MRISLNSIMVKNKNILFRKEGDKIVLLDELTGTPYFLEGTGAFIWNKINGKNSIKDILFLLRKKYSGNEQEMKKDLIEFITVLKNNNLITLRANDTG